MARVPGNHVFWYSVKVLSCSAVTYNNRREITNRKSEISSRLEATQEHQTKMHTAKMQFKIQT